MSDDSNSPDPTRWPPPRYPAWWAEEKQQQRYAELRHREVLSRAYPIELAKGEDEPGEPAGPPLTAAEHLEMIRLGETFAESYRHPGRMGAAVDAGATWAQVAEARGTDEATARRDFREWAVWLHHYGRLSDAGYAAALAVLGDDDPGCE